MSRSTLSFNSTSDVSEYIYIPTYEPKSKEISNSNECLNESFFDPYIYPYQISDVLSFVNSKKLLGFPYRRKAIFSIFKTSWKMTEMMGSHFGKENPCYGRYKSVIDLCAHKAVAIFDHFLLNKKKGKIEWRKFELLGLACLLIACKLDGVRITINQFRRNFTPSFLITDLASAEAQVLEGANYQVNFPSYREIFEWIFVSESDNADYFPMTDKQKLKSQSTSSHELTKTDRKLAKKQDSLLDELRVKIAISNIAPSLIKDLLSKAEHFLWVSLFDPLLLDYTPEERISACFNCSLKYFAQTMSKHKFLKNVSLELIESRLSQRAEVFSLTKRISKSIFVSVISSKIFKLEKLLPSDNL